MSDVGAYVGGLLKQATFKAIFPYYFLRQEQSTYRSKSKRKGACYVIVSL